MIHKVVWFVGFRERDKRKWEPLERERKDEMLDCLKGPTLSLGGRGVFIVTKETPTPGLWIRHTVSKDPSFLHDMT